MENNPQKATGNAYQSEDSEDLLGLVKSLIDGTHPGVLTTVEASGRPHARWMATISLDDFPRIYSLTSDKSRKVGEIEHNPAVNWMFSSPDLSMVVNLAGTARILRDSKSLIMTWNQIRNKSRAYFLRNCTESPGYVTIETIVHSVECCTPQNAMRFAIPLHELKIPAHGIDPDFP